jgi:2-dehydro-3-deoxygalactonokinase
MLIGLDWGTTRLRAYRVGHEGRVEGETRSGPGILEVAGGDFEAAFEDAVVGWVDPGQPPAILACGMIGSRQGWIEAPYVTCPAGLDDLADRLTPLTTRNGCRVWFVPGIKRIDEDGVPDVARGEETQIIGDLGRDAERFALYVLPGTHSKWALVREGRIVWFATFMTGELFAVLSRHSILGRLMEGACDDDAAFMRGATCARKAGKGAGGLLKRLFSARTLALFGELRPEAVRSYLSGLLVGTEIEEALDCIAGLASGRMPEIAIIGGVELAATYDKALRARGLACATRQEDVTARGLFRIAAAAGLVA